MEASKPLKTQALVRRQRRVGFHELVSLGELVTGEVVGLIGDELAPLCLAQVALRQAAVARHPGGGVNIPLQDAAAEIAGEQALAVLGIIAQAEDDARRASQGFCRPAGKRRDPRG